MVELVNSELPVDQTQLSEMKLWPHVRVGDLPSTDGKLRKSLAVCGSHLERKSLLEPVPCGV